MTAKVEKTLETSKFNVTNETFSKLLPLLQSVDCSEPDRPLLGCNIWGYEILVALEEDDEVYSESILRTSNRNIEDVTFSPEQMAVLKEKLIEECWHQRELEEQRRREEELEELEWEENRSEKRDLETWLYHNVL